MKSFEEMQTAVLDAINSDLEAARLSLKEFMAVQMILAQAETSKQLGVLVKGLVSKSPGLQEVVDEEFTGEQAAFEAQLQSVIEKMLMDDPKTAAELSRFINDKNATIEKVTEQYPQVKNYIEYD